MWIWSIIWSAGAEPVPTSTVENTLVVEAEPLDTIDQAIHKLLQPTPKKPPTDQTFTSCPKDQCERYSDTSQESYDRALFDNGQWLVFANQYEVGQLLLPNMESLQTRYFLEWTQDKRGLKVLMENQQPIAFFATWHFDKLTPTDSPFVYSRLSSLQNAKKMAFQSCKAQKVIAKDAYHNPISWKGVDCDGWTLWLSYTPTDTFTLKLMGFPQ